ncbi:MAG: hypothetical protein ABSG91_05810 [Syntrophobacteraceae bacterium]|jgi:hypothetical protein
MSIFVQISVRNFDRTGGTPRNFPFESLGPFKEKDFTLHRDEGIVELKMEGDVGEKEKCDRTLTLHLGLGTCKKLVSFLQSEGLLDVQVRTQAL